eukprot:3403188-Karenia_brevis.AAC.1
MRYVRKKLKTRSRTRKIWSTAIVPGISYGAAVRGVTDQVLRWARARAATLTVADGNAGYQCVAFLLQPEQDPARQLM